MNFSIKKRGFTLIEMLIVIVIIGVLASALIPRLGSARGKANDVARKADLQQVATAIISYQIDQNSFPSAKGQITSSGTMATILKKGGMASIPAGDLTVLWTGIDSQPASGYVYYPMTKNGSSNNGFILASKTETEGGSNFIYKSTDGDLISGKDIETINICSSVTLNDSSNPNAACNATDKSQLRYIYKY